MAQMALAWVLRRTEVTSAIIGASRPEQVADNVRAVDAGLPEDVLARIDTSSVDLTAPMVHRKDGDFPVAWIKSYGQGRVFYTGLGHTDAAWDDPRVRTMMVEAIKWAMGGGQVPRPHPLPVGR